jgi:hypothetical protein
MREHERALYRYRERIERLSPELWRQRRPGGGWSPAEITQHLILSYEIALRNLRGGPAPERLAGPVSSTLLRWFLLPHIFFHRTLPRSRAPREARPSGEPGSPTEALERMRELGAELAEAALSPETDRKRLRHPYFGPISPYQFLRLTTVHLDHHGRQVGELAGSPSR